MPAEQLSFGFAEPPPPSRPTRALRLAPKVAELAKRGVYIGTSSWKYPGWLGQVYDPARYSPNGHFSERLFQATCLGEYAQTFQTVCGDFAFYQFPAPTLWKALFEQVPSGFRLGLKVPEEVTCERFPRLPRYGKRAGQENPAFMDPGCLREQFLALLEPYRDKLGPLILEFGTIHSGPLTEPQAFAGRLDDLFRRLPCDRYELAVEVRNPAFLDGGGHYLGTLREHGVAHCLNSWTRMPPIDQQMRIPGVFTANHVVGRFLLRPGRTYAQAVEQFWPYERVQDPYPEGQSALRRLIEQFVPDPKVFYAFVNNRFEGSAIETIENALAAGGQQGAL